MRPLVPVRPGSINPRSYIPLPRRRGRPAFDAQCPRAKCSARVPYRAWPPWPQFGADTQGTGAFAPCPAHGSGRRVVHGIGVVGDGIVDLRSTRSMEPPDYIWWRALQSERVRPQVGRLPTGQTDG